MNTFTFHRRAGVQILPNARTEPASSRMRTVILCQERWQRIENVLDRLGGKAAIRNLERSYGIRPWEVEQSAELGWLTISTQKPRVGRPSRIAEIRDYSNASVPALPKWRCMIERTISIRHHAFAIECMDCIPRGSRIFGIGCPPLVEAYMRVYRPRSRRGARASVSRLLRHPDVRAMRQWHFAQINHEISIYETMPDTASGIWQRLREAGSSRARFAP